MTGMIGWPAPRVSNPAASTAARKCCALRRSRARRSGDLCTISMAVIEAAAIIGARLFEKR